MSAILLDGKATAAALKQELKQQVDELKKVGITPGLGTILVGSDPASQIYVAGKHRDCEEVGIASIRVDLPADASVAEINAAIDELNNAPECTGFIVQLPLPKGIDTDAVLARVAPEKDADGLHPTNLGKLVLNTSEPLTTPVPCTPRGVIELGKRFGFDWNGKNVCVVGRGKTVGRPLVMLLGRKDVNATVDCCHFGTSDLAAHTRAADAIVMGTGVAHLLTPDMVKPGAAVFDVGVSRKTDPETGKSKIFGDVDPKVADVAGMLTPNPGGVGPMTRAMLLVNIVEEAMRRQ